jgi:4-diphosphocytidyl-2-C-methyl-D-erythritol kinase
MRTVAPAKINWTLEVLGRREDGYHEIRSVMQTIDLCDELWADRSGEPRFETTAGKPLSEDDLIVRATKALEKRTGRLLPAWLRVEKRIPVASGLGGGSSDAAAVLRLLRRLHRLEIADAELAVVGSKVGSDVPFFVYGGTVGVEGRGEKVTPLRGVREKWLVLLIPPVASNPKTTAMYESLRATDFSNGSKVKDAVKLILKAGQVDDWTMINAFERAAYEQFHDLAAYRYALLNAGARAVYLAGSGPTLFAVVEDELVAQAMAKTVNAGGGKFIVAKTVGAEAATAVTD